MTMVSPEQFAQSMLLLLALLFFLAVGVIGFIAAWMFVKLLSQRRTRRRDEAQRRRDKFGHDGEPLPPAAPGLCDRCGRPFGKVYHLPSGRRLCPDDYNKAHGPKKPAPAAAL